MTRYFIVILVFLFAGPAATTDNPDDSIKILKKLDSYRITYDKFYLKLKLTSLKNNKIKETAVFDVYICGSDKSLVIAKKYKTKDMKILYREKNMWVQLPRTRRPIRITPVQRLMGEASNGDVAQLSYAEDYALEPVGKEKIDGIFFFKLKLSARNKSATYNKIVLFARADDYLPVKAEYYLTSGKHYKTAYFEKYCMVGGKKTLQKMTIYDEVKKDCKTTFEYFDIKEKELPAKYYNKNYLIHIKGL